MPTAPAPAATRPAATSRAAVRLPADIPRRRACLPPPLIREDSSGLTHRLRPRGGGPGVPGARGGGAGARRPAPAAAGARREQRRRPPTAASSSPAPIAASHGSGEDGPRGAIPPNPVPAPPAGAVPLPAASSGAPIGSPVGAAISTGVGTAPAAGATLGVAWSPPPLTVRVAVPGDTVWYELTEPNLRLPFSTCPPQLTETTLCLSEAWMTRTSALSDGVASWSSRTCSRSPDSGPRPAT